MTAEPFVSVHWVLIHIIKLTDDEIDQVLGS